MFINIKLDIYKTVINKISLLILSYYHFIEKKQKKKSKNKKQFRRHTMIWNEETVFALYLYIYLFYSIENMVDLKNLINIKMVNKISH